MTDFPRLAGIVFDVDGTLYRHTPVRRMMALRLAVHVTARPRAGWRTVQFVRAYRRAQERMRTRAASCLLDGQLAEACRRTGADPRWGAQVVAEWMEVRPRDLVRRHMRADLVKFLDAARRRGLRLGVFSDYPAEAKLAAMGVREFFHVVRSAQDDDIGAFKPDPRGLLRTIEAMGVTASRALYVGDRIDVDLPAAEAAGLRPAIIGANAPASGSCLRVRNFAELGRVLGL